MPSASALHVVLGAAGGTGSAVVRELVARGLPVRAVTRSGATDVPEGVEQVAADVATPDGARLACAGAAVVYHCAQPPYTKWVELFPPLTRAVLDGTADAGAKLVFADNLYVYGPPEGPPRIVTPCGAPLSGSDTATPPEPPLPTIRWRLLAPAAGRPRRLRHLR